MGQTTVGNVNKTTTTNKKDTTIVYFIEGLSTEGTGAKVLYRNGKILRGDIELFSGTGKNEVQYVFETDKIKVLEKYFIYLTELENVKSDDDIKLTKEQTYFLDYNGNVIGKPIQDRIDIFPDFKKVVPFEIK